MGMIRQVVGGVLVSSGGDRGSGVAEKVGVGGEAGRVSSGFMFSINRSSGDIVSVEIGWRLKVNF